MLALKNIKPQKIALRKCAEDDQLRIKYNFY